MYITHYWMKSRATKQCTVMAKARYQKMQNLPQIYYLRKKWGRDKGYYCKCPNSSMRRPNCKHDTECCMLHWAVFSSSSSFFPFAPQGLTRPPPHFILGPTVMPTYKEGMGNAYIRENGQGHKRGGAKVKYLSHKKKKRKSRLRPKKKRIRGLIKTLMLAL